MASSAPSTERQTSPILDECKRLQEIQSHLAALWQDEVHLYEQSSSVVGMDGGDNYETRNHPNSTGTIDNQNLFPYHDALYPLFDCYDSIRDDRDVQKNNVMRPSPAPLPFHFNGHRRSKFSPRLDRHGVHIEELATLHGHLPNSAWAIKQLMPQKRKLQFMEYETTQRSSSNAQSDNNNQTGQNVQGEPNENIQDEVSRHNHNRFWDILMDPTSGSATVPFSDMSLMAPDEETDEWDDVDGEDSNGIWEDVDDVREDGNNTNSGLVPDAESDAKHARDFTFLIWWQQSIVKERMGLICEIPETTKMENWAHKYSPECLFANSSSAIFVLLRVLKHSLSDLQREYRLARAVVLLIADWHLCDVDNEERQNESGEAGIECLRRLLSVISSEYVSSCGGYCHEWFISNGGISDDDDDDDEYEDLETSARVDAPNHYCSDWWAFLGSLSTLISYGITYMTEQHANIISAFALNEIHRSSSSLGSEDGGNGNTGEALSGKDYLKQNIFFLNNAEYSAGQRGRAEGGLPQDGKGLQLNINLLLTILSALRQHAVSDKLRLAMLLNMKDTPDTISEQISKTLNSFQSCVNIMVDIGERILFRLPNNSHGRQLGGMVIRGLVESYIDHFSTPAGKPLSYLAPELDLNSNLRSLIDPLRYADAVAKASNNPYLHPKRGSASNTNLGHSLEQLIGVQPPEDVQDIIKALFVRDLVDVQVSGCGYGDCLSWLHLPISPEPLLFDYVSNFPFLSGTDDGQPQDNYWTIDEDQTELDYAHLSARYDLSLLMFLRQWNSPWSPESHLSFSISYRQAISTLALCAHRYGVPHDITDLVNSFLPRSWWQDDRNCCWCRECQVNQTKKHFHAKISSRQSNWGSEKPNERLESQKGDKTPTLLSCPGCQVAMACSKEHLKYLHQDGHKRYCGLPPFRAPFSEEDNLLCREIFGKEEDEDVDLLENGDGAHDGNQEDEADDDDGSWESVDSNEEAVESGRSEVIFSFFNNKSYKIQQREAPPFANFF